MIPSSVHFTRKCRSGPAKRIPTNKPMANYLEEVSARFQRWERRTRGWQVHPQPVAPEPVFVPYKIPNPLKQPIIDDAKRPTMVSSLIRALWRAPLPVASTPEDEEEPEPVSFERENLTEFPLLL